MSNDYGDKIDFNRFNIPCRGRFWIVLGIVNFASVSEAYNIRITFPYSRTGRKNHQLFRIIIYGSFNTIN